MASQGFAIETRGLTKRFGSFEALKALDLQVPAHSIFGFLGPNGAGKSTTIKLLLGLIRPSGGSGAVSGLDIVRDSVRLRRKVGYLAQEPRFYDHMTARETLRFAARLFYTGPADLIESRVEESLELTGLAEKADRPVKGLSGGERQRLGIAQAQINRPDVLILDEPAAALDPLGRRDVLAIMERLREQSTVFYSTHILDDVQRVSDTVAILNRGDLIAQAPIEQLLGGNGQAVYCLRVKGDDTEARRLVSGQPWVTELKAEPVNGHSRWTVTVTSDQAAEELLLPMVLNTGTVHVVEFGRKKYNLEEIFVNMVGGN
ncbi:MAG TPA: ABC transporter ATP-binding protein [Symbiobacteriaceae bacterium]|nr:ABC transporter ATP-binding protein [Symbiobacteriaceae bacterium]